MPNIAKPGTGIACGLRESTYAEAAGFVPSSEEKNQGWEPVQMGMKFKDAAIRPNVTQLAANGYCLRPHGHQGRLTSELDQVNTKVYH